MIVRQSQVMFERIRCGIARRFGLDIDLLNSSVSIDELHPAEIISGPPCVVLPGQYERVRAGAFEIGIAKEIAELKGAPRTVSGRPCVMSLVTF